MKPPLPLILTMLCCACASKPYAMIDGTRSSRTDASEEDVMVVAVDSRFVPGRATMRVEPGFHYFYIATTRSNRHGEYNAQPFALLAEPCMRYVLVAKHRNSLSGENWELVVRSVEPIPWCTLTKEAPPSPSSGQK
jgi:hypothetical protein